MKAIPIQATRFLISLICCCAANSVLGTAYTLSSATPSYTHKVSWSNAGGQANSYSFLVPQGQSVRVKVSRGNTDYAGYHEDKTKNQFYLYLNNKRQNFTSDNGKYYFEADVTVNDTIQISCFTSPYFHRETFWVGSGSSRMLTYRDVYYTDYMCAYEYSISISGSGGSSSGGNGGGDGGDSSYDLVFPASGGSKAVVKLDNLFPDCVTGYVEPPDWLSVKMLISGNIGRHYIDAEENNTAKERTATVEFNISNGTKKRITVKQSAGSSSSSTGTSTGTYTLRLHRNNSANDGATAGRTLTINTSRSLPTISELKWTRSGYTFLGWAKSSTAASATYSNGQSVKNLSTTKGATVHLYAVWKKNAPSTYTLRLHRNNSKNDGATAGRTLTINASRNLPTISELKWTRSGYTFLGWAKSSTATSATYSNGQRVENLSTTKGATVHMYAVWKKNAPITYTLRLHRNNSQNDGATAGRTLTVNSSRSLPTISELKWTRNGYTFLGWAWSATDTISSFADGQNVRNLSTTKGATVHIYAVWKKNVQTYKICLCRNNSANDGATAIRTMTIGESRKLPTIAELGWTRKGYRFLRWDGYSESAGKLVSYSDGQVVSDVTTIPNSTIYFYARWR